VFLSNGGGGGGGDGGGGLVSLCNNVFVCVCIREEC